MKKFHAINLATIMTLLTPFKVSAHCPLCTGGAGAAAAAAAYFGVSYGTLGVFLGAFATALALWMAHKLKKQYIKYQSTILFWLIYLSTVLPFYFMFQGDYVSRYISWGGDYGSLTNRTYLVDLFIVGVVLGSVVVYASPKISSWVSIKRGGKMVRFQGLVITFLLLIIAGLLIQVWPR